MPTDTPQAKDIQEFASMLKQFSEKKTILLNKELRDGGERGLNAWKFRSAAALLRTTGGYLKNPDHEAAQRNRLDAISFANYLQFRIAEINRIEKQGADNKASYDFLLQEIAIQYEHFKEHDPKGKYTKILKKALLNLPPIKTAQPMTKQERTFCLLWPLYVTGKHEDTYLKKAEFSAQSALEMYRLMLKDSKIEAFNEELFKNIFKVLKGPTREAIRAKPDAEAKQIDMDLAAKDLGEGKALSAMVHLSDIKMGMVLDPKRMQDFSIQSISAQGYVYAKPSKDGQKKQLKDGWYQYVILAQDAADGSAKKHDMRYFPCITKTQAPIKNGPPPYKKYVAHSEIAGGLPVFAGGAFKVEKGLIVLLDDASGHYEMKDLQQKNASLHYAKQKLRHLGLSKARADNLQLHIMPDMSASAKYEKYKKKASATLTGFVSADVPGLPTRAEDRPRPPKKLRPVIGSLTADIIEESFNNKLINCGFFAHSPRKKPAEPLVGKVLSETILKLE